jgi:hypothetical protein
MSIAGSDETPPELSALRTAARLCWRPYTAFVPHSGADGDLIGEDAVGNETARLPLDIFSPDELTADTPVSVADGVGLVVAAPATVTEAYAAIQTWCREQLQRTDVAFTGWDQA